MIDDFMIDTLIQWDKELFLLINSWHSGFWDVVMWNISKKFNWIPLYALFLYWVIRFYKKEAVWIIVALVVVIAASDLVSVHGFKNVFERLRPCHDPELNGLVHIVNDKCGGWFGFYSSHASNHFAVAVFFALLFKERFRYFTALILFWAALVSYSRIYLGVHFPGDVIAGALIGSLIGWLGYVSLFKLRPSIFLKLKTSNNKLKS